MPSGTLGPYAIEDNPSREEACRSRSTGVGPRVRLRRLAAVRGVVGPPSRSYARRLWQREAQQIFDLAECQHDGVGITVVQVRLERSIGQGDSGRYGNHVLSVAAPARS